MTYTTLSPEEVQTFLDNIGGQTFSVIFLKKDGTQRKMVGYIEPNNKRSEAVPMMEAETGQWRSFRVDSVLSIHKGE